MTLRADGEIYIRSQRALLHPAVRNAGKAHQLAQLFEIFDRLLGASHIRLADYLKQRHSASVAVDERAVVVGGVHELPRVLLHVHLFYAYNFAAVERDRAVSAQRQI